MEQQAGKDDNKILFVDDEIKATAAYKRQLRKKYDIYVANSGSDALELLRTHGSFAVIITDYAMPQMSGIAFLKEVKRYSPDSVLMMLTAHAEINIAVEALHEGKIFRFLTKPCPPEVLEKAVEDALKKHTVDILERKLAALANDLKQANRDLKEKNELLKIANSQLEHWIAFSPAVIYRRSVDCNLAFISVSHNVRNLTGFKAEELCADPGFWLDHIHPDQRDIVLAELKNKAGQDVHTSEYQFRDERGEYRWIHDTFRYVSAADGEIREVIGAWFDITARKNSEDYLQKTVRRAQELNTALEKQQREDKREMELGKQVLDKLAYGNNIATDQFRIWQIPATEFCGDLVLTALKPGGGLYAMVADFTGHGLPAALGAPLVANIFHNMAAEGKPLRNIAAILNQTLIKVLPTHLFCAAALVEFDSTLRNVTIWNGGLPEVFLIGNEGRLIGEVTSSQPPLGIMDYQETDIACYSWTVELGARAFICTDGLIEAQDHAGARFGHGKWQHYYSQQTDPAQLFDKITHDVKDFYKGTIQDDDITFSEITLINRP